MELNEMFDKSQANSDSQNSGRALAGTAQVTEHATRIMNNVLAEIAKKPDEYRPMVTESMQRPAALDTMLFELHDFSSEDVEYLKALDAEHLERIMKSQQSKRSRAKGKAMTMENYKEMVTAAIAEHLVRQATGKDKTTHAASIGSSLDGGYTDEAIAMLADDQEALRRELRNVQSKKSILKSKENFSEDDPRWIALMTQEAQLKEHRTSIPAKPRAPRTDVVRSKLLELIGDKDPSSMKSADLKALLSQVQEVINPAPAVADDETDTEELPMEQ